MDNILYEYKGAIDTSFIVSKTDIDGKIIYINKKFCEISGYSYDELIGKPHNIVRHPDMSAAAFEEMWRTILDKKTWRGRITNLKKSGDPYIVESVVSPIFYPDGEIKEFIAIRYDVTEAVAVGKKLIEEKQARKEQEILNEALHKINAAKDSFLLVFTHELKTPLNAVINFSDYINNELKDKGKDFEELVELAGTIRQSGLFMLETVDALLELGRLKAHKLDFYYRHASINALIEQVVSQNSMLISNNNLAIHKNLSCIHPLMIDTTHLIKVINNLLSNAIKYGKTQIMITTTCDDEKFMVSIEDDGDGVEVANREKIFELFEQADDCHLTRKAKGTGIGLHFVKLLCQEMNYTIECDESPTLKGARFTISGNTEFKQ